jgi:hypothetical protein
LEKKPKKLNQKSSTLSKTALAKDITRNTSVLADTMLRSTILRASRNVSFDYPFCSLQNAHYTDPTTSHHSLWHLA